MASPSAIRREIGPRNNQACKDYTTIIKQVEFIETSRAVFFLSSPWSGESAKACRYLRADQSLGRHSGATRKRRARNPYPPAVVIDSGPAPCGASRNDGGENHRHLRILRRS